MSFPTVGPLERKLRSAAIYPRPATRTKTFYIFSSAFSVKLSIDCINIVVLHFLLAYLVVDFIV